MRAIGVFDSGLGGLTVARAIMAQLPHEALVYVGDTARVPYGPKSPETVQRYAVQIAEWLVEQGVKIIVVACNTATAHALGHLQATLPVPVIGVVEPGARAAVHALGRIASDAAPHIGVIGTAGTIASGAYERAIHALHPAAHVHGQACGLFVPLVEEGWTDHAATTLIAHEYLAPLRAIGVTSLVLGCTHYPLLADVIQREMGAGVHLIDSAAETAAETARVLRAAGLAETAPATADRAVAPTHRWIASDAPERFLVLARRFLHTPIERVEHVAFG